jgi:hypothetical protein
MSTLSDPEASGPMPAHSVQLKIDMTIIYATWQRMTNSTSLDTCPCPTTQLETQVIQESITRLKTRLMGDFVNGTQT